MTVDIGGGLQAEHAICELLESAAIASGDVAFERAGSTLEFLSKDAAKLRDIAAQLSTEIPGDGADVEVSDTMLLETVTFDYANLLNRARKGVLVLPGDAVLMIACAHTGQVGVLANRLEADNSRIRLVNIDNCAGQLTLKGPLACLQRIDAELTRVSS